MLALDAVTGALKWSCDTGGYIDSSPPVVGGVVYVDSGDLNLYVLDAVTGTLKWSYTTGSYRSYIYSSPAVANGVVYVGSTNAKLYALHPVTCPLNSIYPTPDRIHSSPAPPNHVV